jgi:GNAT superfamily N-acetyltransferase
MIREATHDDIPTMLAMGEAMHGLSRFARHPWDARKVGQLIAGLIDNPHGLAVVTVYAGEIVGGMLAAASPHWAVDALEAQDFALYVAPDSRGDGVAVRLLREYVRWARDLGVPDSLICAGSTADIDPGRLSQAYTAAGFLPAGSLFTFGGSRG